MKKNIELRNAIVKAYNDDIEHSYLLRSIVDNICLSEKLIDLVVQSFYETTTIYDLLYSYLTVINDKGEVVKDDVTKDIMFLKICPTDLEEKLIPMSGLRIYTLLFQKVMWLSILQILIDLQVLIA